MLATGKIRNYQIVVGGAIIMTVLLCWLMLSFGYASESTVIIYIIVSLTTLFLRLFMLKGMTGLSVIAFVNEVIVKCVICYL